MVLLLDINILMDSEDVSEAVFSLKPQGIDATIDILVGNPLVERGGVVLGK